MFTVSSHYTDLEGYIDVCQGLPKEWQRLIDEAGVLPEPDDFWDLMASAGKDPLDADQWIDGLMSPRPAPRPPSGSSA